MNDIEQYILDAIETRVWSGLYRPDIVNDAIEGLLVEKGVDRTILRSAIAAEFEKKAAAELLWPNETDCDRLDAAFEMLNANGIVALHNAGYTMLDGFSEVDAVIYDGGVMELCDAGYNISEVFSNDTRVIYDRGREFFKGYCFYQEQDLESAVKGDGLTLAFGDLDDDAIETVKIGNSIKKVLEAHGFAIEWGGAPKERIRIPAFDWKRRLSVE
ncbi:MAG: hypothetical protein MUE44_21690 [Oscillatoriaceae cyanobacterium Prado104]|jgi:hypothetical protein|nr:hypothetical protein [Oscillatoriaceae cyanobacterium Prado104]